ncbi:YraN family protein [Pusillimonas sp. MFBS29]|uniref:YraN family protein n=1 Tax=Pusillimonas sp. MFBS29 TaxID=2886690 RepID=UPI001D12EC3C|nr:YraN family protein [Pusillimonas sp. MFBS29]MCC2597722.1 YraN family protein [Pusillimonas sp. MFBS29]
MDSQALPYQLARVAQRQALRARRRKNTIAPRSGAAGQTVLSPTQRTGREAEERACRYLQDQGLIVLGCNLRSKTGELDLVANDHGVLAFIEVRHRGRLDYGGAAASVNRSKQQRLIKTARFFLPALVKRYFNGCMPACRFDVISVEPAGLTWIRGAFSE